MENRHHDTKVRSARCSPVCPRYPDLTVAAIRRYNVLTLSRAIRRLRAKEGT